MPRRFRPLAASTWIALWASAVVTAAGCWDAEPATFEPSEAYAGLLEEVRTGTRAEVEDLETGERAVCDLGGYDALLAERFGTPADPAVYTKLPVHFGAGSAVAADVTPGDPPADADADPDGVDPDDVDPPVPFTLRLSPDAAGSPPAPAVGQPLHWTSYGGTPLTRRITAVDGFTVTAAAAPAGDLPADGDRVLVGEPDVLRRGAVVYAAQCATCHGVTGSGDGPSAAALYPKPRNYHPGVYKFTSTGTAKPSRADLSRVLRDGVPGTSMPAFSPSALDADDLAAVVEYVRWLSMRGGYESGLAFGLGFDVGEEAVAARLEAGETREQILDILTADWQYNVLDLAAPPADDVARSWAEAETTPPLTPDIARPEPTPAFDEWVASVRRGRALYLSPDTKCVDCHGVNGDGRGPLTVAEATDEATGEPYDRPGLHDVWGDVVRPRNLNAGVYHGGDRPVDLYRRIHSGITGSKMPGFGQSLSDEQIWDVVNFVLALPRDSSLLKGATVAETH